MPWQRLGNALAGGGPWCSGSPQAGGLGPAASAFRSPAPALCGLPHAVCDTVRDRAGDAEPGVLGISPPGLGPCGSLRRRRPFLRADRPAGAGDRPRPPRGSSLRGAERREGVGGSLAQPLTSGALPCPGRPAPLPFGSAFGVEEPTPRCPSRGRRPSEAHPDDLELLLLGFREGSLRGPRSLACARAGRCSASSHSTAQRGRAGPGASQAPFRQQCASSHGFALLAGLASPSGTGCRAAPGRCSSRPRPLLPGPPTQHEVTSPLLGKALRGAVCRCTASERIFQRKLSRCGGRESTSFTHMCMRAHQAA